MITYLIKSASCLALLLVFYHLVLEREKMHNFNRFYLLGSVIFSFLAPLFIIYITVPTEETFSKLPIVTEQFLTTNSEEYIEPINYTPYLLLISLAVSSILSIRFIKNLTSIVLKIKQNEKIVHQKATLVLVDDKITPHTFWNYIFINKEEYNSKKIEQELFTHELTHATQKHTLDVLLIEALKIVFWFNPIFYFLKKSIQLNHEFLADTNVINNHKNISEYQYLLLNKTAWNNEYYLASNLNYLLTKKRLQMMTKQSSKTKILLKKLAVIPLLVGFIFLYAERVEAQENTIEEIVEEVPYKNNLDNSDFYKEYVYRNGYTTVKDKNGKKIKKKYSDLTKEEKKKLPPPPPLKSKKKVPTKKTIEDLKDSKKYALWIDGKFVKNSVLSNYKNTDFSSYFVSFVHKNAKSNRFPQNYQASLSTNKYFRNENKKRANDYLNYLEREKNILVIEEQPLEIIKTSKKKSSKQNSSDNKISYLKIEDAKRSQKATNYRSLNSLYNKLRNQKPHYVKSSKKRQRELDNLFSKLGSMYFKLSKTDKRKVKRPVHPFKPYLKLKKNNKVFYKLRKDLTEEDKLLFPPPPPRPNASRDEILKAKQAYNNWKKRTGNDGAPPPPPRNHLDQVIKMAKKGAKFYFEGERINSDKAIKLLKENKRLNIHSKSTNNSNYEVWISKKPMVKEIKVKNPKQIASKNKNIKYFLNNKPIAKSILNMKIKPNNIKAVSVKKDKNGSGSIYITSK